MDAVREKLEEMRIPKERFWSALRKLVRAKGLDPDELLLAWAFPDDGNSEAGYLVDPGGKIYWFSMTYGPITFRGQQSGFTAGAEGDLSASVLPNPVRPTHLAEGEGYFREWEEVGVPEWPEEVHKAVELVRRVGSG